MLTAIRNWVIKTMLKNNTGVVQTLPKRDLIEFNTQITAQRLMQNGVDPEALKNVNQVENAVNAIDNRPRVQEGIGSTKSAKIMDMEGKEIKDPKNIMGGKEINQQTLNEELMKTDSPFSDLVNTPRPKTIKEREAEVLAGMEKNNKEAVQRIRNRKMVEEAIDNASLGFVKGDRKYNAQLVADDLAEKKFGKDFYDLDQKQQMDLYGEALDGLDDSDKFAQGGRAGFKIGEIVKKNIPEEYRLYLKSILPGGEEGKVDESYFTEKFKKELRSQALDKFLRTGKTRGIVTEGDQHRGDPTINKLIKFPSTYAALGTYTYDIDPKTMDVKITDKYDFNPAYGSKTIGGKTYTGYVGDKEGTDVGLGMFKDKFKESIRDKSVDTANVLEMIGNYFGGKQSEGKGFDVDIDIPMEEATTATEGSFAKGGRAGFKAGLGKRFLELLKPKPKPKFDVERFREGPIDLKFLENIDKKDLAPFIRTRDTMGPGGYGMYDDFADMPAGLKAAELIKTIKGPRNEINYKAAELFLGKKLKGNESADELIQMLNRQEMRADGGRAGFDKGGMTRRSFLKILGGLAAIPIVGKFLKPIKTAKGIKSVPIIKTDNVAGKPEWFDALVNKVIIEGDDVTKKFATGERQSIHQKTLDDGSVVRVTEDVDDGAVRVEYQSEQNVFGDDVLMEYKKPLPDEGAPRPAAEFTTAESGPVGRQVGPDDYDIDVDEVGGSSIKDLDSDVSKLKEYATGKKPTMKEFIQSKKRRDRAKDISVDLEAQSDAVVRRQGEMDSSDYETLGTGDDYASGGIARMLGE